MLHLDFETRSAANIKKAGGWAYAADPSTRILICCIRLDDGPVLTWTVNDDEGQNGQVIELLSGYKGPMCAHNAYFERAISYFRMQKDMGIPAPALEQWTCTAAMARKAALPSSLADVAEVLKLDVQKDKRGFQLITLFSIPNKDGSYNNHSTHPDRWLEFIEYCKRDVDTEAAVFKHLHPWKLSEEELGYFHADMKMNERGIPLNIPMVEKCQKLVEEDLVDADFTFELLTGGIRHTQRAVFLAWLKERGYTADDLKADTLENYDVTNLPWEAAEAIRIRRGVTFASVKKLPTMLECQVDGKVHGGLLWWGAERTGRWAGRMIQPQNFKRPVKGSEDWYQLLKESDLSAEDIRALGENPTELVAVMMRHFIDANEPILDADYAQIEARIVAWIAGQDDLLDLFSRKVDVYKAMASKIFGKPTDKIDSAERFLGKQAVLGCLAEGTRVLTQNGWTPIEKVDTSCQLWDGMEWVDHKGLIQQGTKETLNLSGLWLTPDHQILCGERWMPASAVQEEGTLSQALAKGAENLPSKGLSRGSVMGLKGSLSRVTATIKNTLSISTTSRVSKLRDALFVRGKKGLKPEKIGGLTQKSFPMMQFVRGCLTDCLPKLAGATTPRTSSMPTMAVGGYMSAKPGWGTEASSYGTVKRLTGGIIKSLKSTALMLTKGTNRETYALSHAPSTTQTSGQFGIYRQESLNLRKRTATYDLHLAGPRNRFTVWTAEGPVIVHNCGYGMGVDKFIGTCAGYGQTVSHQMGNLVVKRWREANSHIVNLWYATEKAAITAMAKPGTTVYVQGAKRPVCYKATKVYDLPVLVCKTPSGRIISYPWPKIEDGRLTYSGKQQGKKAFGRIDTWGGKLVENIVQAVAGHIMSEGLIQADRLGFEVFMLVHDQALAYARDKDPDLFAKALTTMPSWADGLPLEADTKTQPFYTK